MDCVNFFSYESLFSTRLRELIDNKGVSKQTISAEIGVSRQAISQYCDGSTVPNADKLLKIADYFGVSLDYLVGRTDTPTTDRALRAVCDYTGLSEKAIQWLHTCSLDDMDFHKNELNFVSLFITEYSTRLSDYALKYIHHLQSTVIEKEYLVDNKDNISKEDFEVMAGECCRHEALSNLNFFLFQKCATEILESNYKEINEKNNALEMLLEKNTEYQIQKMFAETI